MEAVEGAKMAIVTVAMDRVVAVVMVVNPTPAASGRAMIKLHWLFPLLVVLGNTRSDGA
jgi:hypothetical protein